ncbi:hypothetical protein GY45DRAFT_1375384 [Cubamyces sp. BRFM 1775]|nr:hypothetical protein GY45DRAFT_1375384 [Cubamyces sp. BRFM 1775]
MPRAYTSHVFRCLPPADEMQEDFIKRVRTPPYISSTPSARFVGLEPLWCSNPVVVLFSDGGDLVVDGSLVFTPDVHSGADPVDIAARLLSERADPRIKAFLGHQVEPRWSQELNKTASLAGEDPPFSGR